MSNIKQSVSRMLLTGNDTPSIPQGESLKRPGDPSPEKKP